MEATGLNYRPLYRVVREALLKRLIDGTWPAGTLLPSEPQLAGELGVSVGTVRKALDALAAERLVERRQGRGTFVAVPEEGRLLFQYFRLALDGQESRPAPTSIVRSIRRDEAGPMTAKSLGIPSGASVWVVDRVRSLSGRPVISEELYLPIARFPDLDLCEVPNSIYALYSKRYGMTVRTAKEKLKAVLASETDAALLGIQPGSPLLLIDRIAFVLDGTPVERRVSRCSSDTIHYASELG